MTEYQKMISGELYYAMDPELARMREQTRALLDEINRSLQDIRSGEKHELCQKLFAGIGPDTWIQPPFFCDYGVNITLGKNVFINFNCVFLDVAKITIGDFVQIGPNVQIYTATHPLGSPERRAGQEYGKPITIQDDVWIGGGAIICPGVTIGEKSIIGAGSVITKDVPSGVIVVGNPGKVLTTLKTLGS